MSIAQARKMARRTRRFLLRMHDFLTTIRAMKRLAVAATILGLAPALPAAELAVISVGAVRSPFAAASSVWEKASGNTVTATFNPAGDVEIVFHNLTEILPVQA